MARTSRLVYADLVVPAGSELHIGPSSVSFARFDLSRRGVSSDFAELIVEGALTIEGMAGQRAELTTDPGPENDGLWYGIHVLPGAQVEVQHAELTRTAFAFSGGGRRGDELAHCRLCGARKRRQRPAADGSMAKPR